MIALQEIVVFNGINVSHQFHHYFVLLLSGSPWYRGKEVIINVMQQVKYDFFFRNNLLKKTFLCMEIQLISELYFRSLLGRILRMFRWLIVYYYTLQILFEILIFNLIELKLTEHDFIDRFIAKLFSCSPKHFIVGSIDLNLKMFQ